MKLRELLKALNNCQACPATDDFEVAGISCDSKKVGDNFIFVAIQGTRQDGHDFISEAMDRGAKAIIVDNSKLHGTENQQVVFLGVGNTHKALAQLAAAFYGYPSGKLKVVGVTGTNGKTTVTYLIEAILKEANKHPAVIGTINYRFQDMVLPARNTTPGPEELQAMLKKMLDHGADYAVMEVSSHALAQGRTESINFQTAIFTNLTQDHLDYHKTLEAYFQAKAGLFAELAAGSLVLLNNDDAYAKRLIKITKAKVVTYGIKYNVDILAKDIRVYPTHTEFILDAAGHQTRLKSPLIGRHNVYNLLASIGFALNEGLNIGLIKSAIEKFVSVPGRLQRIDSARGFDIFVDYAHTEDALRNCLAALREISQKKIIVVFGCGGERDKTKRPKMGEAATELADYAVITNDNPRSENALSIISDIKSGIRKNNYCVVPDRKEAIRKALALAKAGDIVLAAGKGHENYQILNGKTIHFDDREIIRECLK